MSESWRTVPVDGATYPLQTQRLAADQASGARTLLVRFPAGFDRPAAGFYAVGEEFLILRGDLIINGQQLGAGDWVSVPAGTVRRGTASATGAVALAWFAGSPIWHEGEGSGDTGPLVRRQLDGWPFST